MSFIIEKDRYSVAATSPCNIEAKDDKVTSEIWFRTPALDKDILDKLLSIQLETTSRDQGHVDFAEAGSWSWFEMTVFESPQSSEIKVKDGLALLWFSHENKLGSNEESKQTGPLFGAQHDLLTSLEVGNVLGVRVCARFPGWENHASAARLILGVSEKSDDKGPRRRPDSLPNKLRKEYLGVVSEQITSLTEAFDTYLDAATPEKAPPAYSLVREMLPTGPIPANQVVTTEEPPLRLLSFGLSLSRYVRCLRIHFSVADGGGVRGISSLYILQAIMAKLSPNDPNMKPCNYFDMMSGTSTGGLIALMLGRLKMSISECIEQYESLASDIFSANLAKRILNFSTTGAFYKATKFEKALKRIIKEKTGDENAPMLDTDPTNKCKVFVVSGRSQNLSVAAEHFRTYPTKLPDPYGLQQCAIWQAARATSAAPTYLPPIKINKVEFIDGGMRFNNSSILLLGEVNAVFGADSAGFGIARHIKCLVSIGTGRQGDISIKPKPSNVIGAALYTKSLIDASIKIMTDCEATHNLMKGLFYGKDNVYFRFSAGVQVGGKWMPMIGLDEYEKMSELVTLTKAYLTTETAQLQKCAAALALLQQKS
ncbi:hypothetical protein H0H92_009788 [Tricholoma furcatifolium]|nr:hypothetical protein H0H92_009788 [Tricholoma furcatifolium]